MTIGMGLGGVKITPPSSLHLSEQVLDPSSKTYEQETITDTRFSHSADVTANAGEENAAATSASTSIEIRSLTFLIFSSFT
jgi:hypothetical protein